MSRPLPPRPVELRDPIGRKLFLIIMFTAAASIGVTFVALGLNDVRILRDQQRSRLAALAEVTGRNARAAISFRDAQHASELLVALRAERHVRRGAILLADGTPLATYSTTGTPSGGAIDLRPRATSTEALRPVQFGGQTIGHVFLRGDEKVLRALMLANFRAVSLIALAAGALAVVLALLLQRAISRPLRELSEVAQRVAQQRDYSVRAPERSRDEIGALARNLNGMLRQIERGEAELRRSNEELAKSNRELEQFAYIASHDLQEPLRKIITFSERLGEHGEALPPQARDYLERMQSAGRRMKSVIEDLLQYSRIAKGEGGSEPVDLRDAVEDVLADLEMLVSGAGAEIVVGALPVVAGNASQIRHLFQNLITNAVKFARKGVRPRILIEASETAEGTVVRVADNGIGFDEKYKEKIFQPFQRLHPKGEYQGTGIGLSIVDKIVHNHGGSIDVTSRPGEGSTFVVTFPKPSRTAPAIRFS